MHGPAARFTSLYGAELILPIVILPDVDVSLGFTLGLLLVLPLLPEAALQVAATRGFAPPHGNEYRIIVTLNTVSRRVSVGQKIIHTTSTTESEIKHPRRAMSTVKASWSQLATTGLVISICQNLHGDLLATGSVNESVPYVQVS